MTVDGKKDHLRPLGTYQVLWLAESGSKLTLRVNLCPGLGLYDV